MVDLGVDMDRLRADYRLVRDWCVECGEWTDADADEIGAGIKAAVDAPDFGELAFWAEWMAMYAEIARAHFAELEWLDQAAMAWAQQRREAA